MRTIKFAFFTFLAIFFSLSANAGDPKHDAVMAAIDNRNFDELKKLVREGAEFDFYDKNYNWGTPLLKAIAAYDEQSVLFLVQEGANVNRTGSGDYTPLYYAVQNCSEQVIDLMLKKGAKANQYVDGYTPLHRAIMRGNYAIVKLLIDAGADINKPAKNSEAPQPYNPLRLVQGADSAMCAFLLSLNYPKQWVDESTPNLLFIGAQKSNSDLVKACLKAGYNPAEMNSNGFTPLHVASKSYQPEKAVDVIKVLLEKGVDVNQKTQSGKTPMDLALDMASGDPIWMFLAKNGGKFSDNSSYTKMESHLADATYDYLWKEKKQKALQILEYGLYSNLRDFLFKSIENKNHEALELAINYKANVGKADYNGNTPLFYALKMSDSVAFTIILKSQTPEKQAELNTEALKLWFEKKNFDGSRQISWALQWPLLPNELYYDNGNQRSLLHFAALKADSATVLCLVNKHKGSPLKQDNYGTNTYDILSKSNNFNIIASILSKKERILELDSITANDIVIKSMQYDNSTLFFDIVKTRAFGLKTYREILNYAIYNKNEKTISFLESYIIKGLPKNESKSLLIRASLAINNSAMFTRYFDPKSPKKEIDSLFRQSCFTGADKIVRILVKFKPNINDTDAYGHTTAYNLLVYSSDIQTCLFMQKNGAYAFFKNNLKNDTLAAKLVFPVWRYKTIRKIWRPLERSDNKPGNRSDYENYQISVREMNARSLVIYTAMAFEFYRFFVDEKSKEFALAQIDLNIAMNLAKDKKENADNIYNTAEKALLALLRIPRKGVPQEVENLIEKEIMNCRL